MFYVAIFYSHYSVPDIGKVYLYITLEVNYVFAVEKIKFVSHVD
jgi:hypothetical protein